jgi:3-phenylpropionate/trans-cinnamate dioxygenase ferredoxin reductase component
VTLPPAPSGRAIAVVGAGLAGLSAVRALRSLGYDGRLVLVGDEPHAPYDRPPLSKEFLAGTLPWEGLELAAPSDEDLDVEIRLGVTAVALDPVARRVTLDSGEEIGGHGVVIATGARARTLPGPVPAGVHTLRTVDDAVALRRELREGRRLVIVGAGFIGGEVASTARAAGVEVALVEAAQVPLAAPLGERMGAVCAELHTDHGVRLIAGTGVSGLVAASGRVCAVRLGDGRELPADVVVVGIGSAPNVEWLSGSGLDVAGGVRTDVAGATGAPGIVATGDCARKPDPWAGRVVRQEHWTNALHHPAQAAASLLGSTPPAQPPQAAAPYFWSDQYGVRIQFAGHRPLGAGPDVVDGEVRSRSFTAVYRRGGLPVAVLAMNSPRTFGRWRRAVAAAAPALAT